MNTIHTLADLANQIESKEDFSFGLKNFLDCFYASPDIKMLQDEPRLLRDVLQDDGFADAYLGAVAEHLSRINGWNAPRWSMSRQRMLEYPFFAASSFKMQRLLLGDSPAAFRWRNIFVSRDALSRA